MVDIMFNVIVSGVVALIVALTAYRYNQHLNNSKKNREYSQLGVVVMRTIKEEIHIGLEHFKSYRELLVDKKYDAIVPIELPHKTWSGLLTVNDDIMIRIINNSDKDISYHWHPTKIRSHCKNYFEHLRKTHESNVIRFLNTKDKDQFAKSFIKALDNFIDATDNVMNMLNEIEKSLEENSKRKNPK